MSTESEDIKMGLNLKETLLGMRKKTQINFQIGKKNDEQVLIDMEIYASGGKYLNWSITQFVSVFFPGVEEEDNKVGC